MLKAAVGVCLGLAVVALIMLPGPSGLLAQSKEDPEGCVETAKGPIGAEGGTAAGGAQPAPAPAAQVHTAGIGKTAPDFEANGFAGGKFTTVNLSDYRGQWVVLCFYPGDFTFV